MADRLEQRGSVDGAFSLDETHRFRFNVFRAGGRLSIAIRKLDNAFRSLAELGLDDSLYRVCDCKDGLVLLAGPTGSGKSTTMATLINRINETRRCHIITIEDPIEFIHLNKQAWINQRQVGIDTNGFGQALIDAVRQDPDVILVGELRDLDTIRTAIIAAETGHLVLATVHAGDCIGAIERMIGVFPGDEQTMVRQLLSTTLRAVIAQHLLVGLPADKPESERRGRQQRVLASESLHVNSAVANLIASNSLVQIRSVMETGSREGMYTLDQCLARLWRRKLISEATARSLARNPNVLFELARAI